MLAGGKGAFHIGVGNGNFFNVAALDFGQESAEGVWLFATCRGALDDLIQQDGRQQKRDPEQDRFGCRIQSKTPCLRYTALRLSLLNKDYTLGTATGYEWTGNRK